MKKALKYGVIGVIAFLVLAFVVPFLIPADTYKKYIVKEVENRINGKLEVSSMRIRLVPLPGFELKEVKLTATSGTFAGEPIVAAKEISGSVQLIPLFSKKLIASLKLLSPEVYFSTSKAGKTNIEDLIEKKEGEVDNKPQAIGRGLLISNAYAEGTKDQAQPSGWKLMVEGVEIKDGLLKISKEGEVPLEIKRLDFKLSDYSPDSSKTSSPVYLAVSLFGSEEQNLKIDGRFIADLKNKTADIKKWKVTLGKAVFDLNGKASFGIDKSAHLELKLPSSTIGSILAFDPRLYSSIPSDVSKNALNKTSLSMDINADYEKDSVQINKLNVSLGGTALSATGSISAKDDLQSNIKAVVSPIRMDEIKDLLPALKALADISSPSLVLRASGPLVKPKSLSFAGHIDAAKVRYQDYEITDLKSDIKYTPAKIRLDSLTGSLYGGALKGSGELAMSGEPAYAADVDITNVDMSQVPATKALLKGKGTLNVSASGKGTDEAAIKKNLKANGRINLADGDIPSLKLGEKIFGSSAWNILAGPGIIINMKGLNELRSLDASCKNFGTSFKIENGVVTTPDVKWQHPKYSVALKGSITMDQELDYQGQFSLSKPTTDVLIANPTAKSLLVNKGGELSVPFSVGGTTSAPNVKPDEKYLASLFTKVVTEFAAKKAVDTVKDVVNIQGPGKKILQGIFGK